MREEEGGRERKEEEERGKRKKGEEKGGRRIGIYTRIFLLYIIEQ